MLDVYSSYSALSSPKQSVSCILFKFNHQSTLGQLYFTRYTLSLEAAQLLFCSFMFCPLVAMTHLLRGISMDHSAASRCVHRTLSNASKSRQVQERRRRKKLWKFSRPCSRTYKHDLTRQRRRRFLLLMLLLLQLGDRGVSQPISSLSKVQKNKLSGSLANRRQT